ncbi:uncharacterized protein LOC142024933 [Carettochelys insculpta]|uniref:uncharacterized protein LOC142024933 n=1 Tax=Carettochelys insculpta TaxID=44489 RepID=UPI003EB6D95F
MSRLRSRCLSSHPLFACLLLLLVLLCSRRAGCRLRECDLSPCQDVTPLSRCDGGSLLFPLNISATSLCVCKCNTSTASCEAIAVILNEKSQMLSSSDPHPVSVTNRHLNVTNACKSNGANYKVVDSLTNKCLAVRGRPPLSTSTSRSLLDSERSPNRTAEEGPRPRHGGGWIVGLALGLGLVLVLGLVLLITAYKKKRLPAISSLLQGRLCLSASATARQPGPSSTVSLEMEEETRSLRSATGNEGRDHLSDASS